MNRLAHRLTVDLIASALGWAILAPIVGLDYYPVLVLSVVGYVGIRAWFEWKG